MKNSLHRDEYPAMQSNGPLPQVGCMGPSVYIGSPLAQSMWAKRWADAYKTHAPIRLYRFRLGLIDVVREVEWMGRCIWCTWAHPYISVCPGPNRCRLRELHGWADAYGAYGAHRPIHIYWFLLGPINVGK